MHGELIAFDIETTGLDTADDEIIEIGIAKLENGKITAQYRSFVKPSIPIPTDITHLTGIYPEDVEDAPPLQQILPELETFFGQRPVIAHNAQFDVGFMRKYGLLDANAVLDTYKLASILLPTAARYSLGSLTADAGIQLEQAHRALDDAIATALLYWKLWEKAIQVPSSVLEEIVNASIGKDWNQRHFFENALAESLKSGPASQIATAFFADELDAEALNLEFSRIQFTPDLMPADILGTNMVVETPDGGKAFEFQQGPIFTQICLADGRSLSTSFKHVTASFNRG